MAVFIPSVIVVMTVILSFSYMEISEAQERIEPEKPTGIPHPERGFEPCVIERIHTHDGASVERCEPNKRMNYFIIFESKNMAKGTAILEELNREDIDRGTRFKDDLNTLESYSDEYFGMSGSYEFSNSDGIGKINAIKAKMNSLGINDAVYAEIRVIDTWHHFEELRPCELIEVVTFGDKSIFDKIQ